MRENTSAREAAARALFAIREDDAWSAPALKKYAAGLSKRDAALATALVGGVRFLSRALLQGSFEKGSSARAGCPAHGGVSNGLDGSRSQFGGGQ